MQNEAHSILHTCCTMHHGVDPWGQLPSSPPEETKKGKKKKKRRSFPIRNWSSAALALLFFFCRPPSLAFFFFFSLFFLFLSSSSSSSRCYLYFVLHLFFSFPLRCDTPELSFSPRKKFSLFSFLLKIPPALFFKKIPFLFRSSTASLSYDFLITVFLISLYNVL